MSALENYKLENKNFELIENKLKYKLQKDKGVICIYKDDVYIVIRFQYMTHVEKNIFFLTIEFTNISCH